jgi:acetylglutamate kinase
MEDGSAPGDAAIRVVKYGGAAMTDDVTRRATAAALGRLRDGGTRLVVVHGGGPAIAQALAATGVESRFVRGRRVTDWRTIGTVEAALTLLGKRLAQEIGAAVGLTGRDAQLLTADVADPELGRVGRMTGVATRVLDGLAAAGLTPVLACLAVDAEGQPLNVNADEVAAAVAGALRAPVTFLTDVPGVLDDADAPDSLLPRLTATEARARLDDGRIGGGMIPKVESALAALTEGAPSATIADGRHADALSDAVSGRSGTRLVPAS